MQKKKILAHLVALALIVSSITIAPFQQLEEAVAAPAYEPTPIYKNESYSYVERAADLVARMTLAEKASQTAGYSSAAIPRLGVAKYMWWNEAIHGFSQEGWFGFQTDGASYPSSYSMGASWDPDLYYNEAVAIGAEIRERVRDNKYNLTFYSPTVNLARDPRWGRNDEGYSEDPFLTGLMGASFVKGVEGKTQEGEYKIKNANNGEGVKQAVTTTKHYAANNTEKNRYTSGADNVTQREMREYYTRPYRNIIQDADVSSVMMAYSSVAGVPISFSSFYMDTLLRQTFGFSGYTTSDCDSVATSYNRNVHKTNPLTGINYTLGEAFANAMANGLDLQCNAGETDGLGSYGSNYKSMLQDASGGKIKTDKGFFTEQQLEITTLRLMEKRMQLGEFDTANTYAAKGKQDYDAGLAGTYKNGALGQTQERIDLADDLSRSTIVLMKNDNVGATPALPIRADEINAAANGYKVAVIGPVGQSNFRGGYSSFLMNEQNLVTIEQAIKMAFADPSTYDAATRAKIDVSYHYGFSSPVSRNSFNGLQTNQITTASISSDLDLAIVVIGQGQGDSREDGDRTNLLLRSLNGDAAQIELLKKVKAKNPKKLIIVMETYGPIQMENDIVDNADAILWSCFNGFRKGTGFGEAITGKNNPSGRTNATWLKDMVADTPGFFDYSLFPTVNGGTESGGRTYMYNAEETIYPFGYGLSYSEIAYSKAAGENSILGAASEGTLQVGGAGDPITKDSAINVKVQVSNTSDIPGKQVVEIYAVSPDVGIAHPEIPKKRLVGFRKVMVGAQSAVTVTVPVKTTDLALFDESKDCYVLPNGQWTIWAARSSEFDPAVDLHETFEVVNGDIREDPSVVTAKPTQYGDNATVNGVTERVIFDLGANDAQNTIQPNVAVTMVNEKLYGTRVINNEPGKDIGVDPLTVSGQSANGLWVDPDTAKDAARIEQAGALPKVGEKYILPAGYSVTYASNRPDVVAVGTAAAGVFSADPIVMKKPGVATITAKVVSPDGEEATGEFVVYVQDAAGLSGITVGGQAIADFSANTLTYNRVVPADTAASSADVAVQATYGNGVTVTFSTTDDGTGKTGYAPAVGNEGVKPATIPGRVYIKAAQNGHEDIIYTVSFEEQFKPTSFVAGAVDGKWSVLNEDSATYDTVAGYGLKLPTATNSIGGKSYNWKNVFARPGGGDWSITAKVFYPVRPAGQSLILLAWQDDDNFIRLHIDANRSMALAPEIGGESNGGISTPTTIPAITDPLVIYYKLQREGYSYKGWYSTDGLNFIPVRSTDGKRTGENSLVNDVKVALFAASNTPSPFMFGPGNPSIDTYCEYIDATSLNGAAAKTDQQVLDDAFKAVVTYLPSKVPTKVSADIALPVPYDYSVKYETASQYIASDGKVTRPSGTDATATVKITVSHPTAKIDGKSDYVVYDGPITVTATSTGGGWIRPPSGSGGGSTPSAPTTQPAVTEPSTDGTGGTDESSMPTGPLSKFTDASSISSWAQPFFEKLVQSEVISGYEDGTLKPKGNVTRAEFTKMIVSALKIPAGGTAKAFPADVKAGDWHKEFVDIASAYEIVNGVSDTSFAPSATITRQDLAAIAYRALVYLKASIPSPSSEKFSDDAAIADYAKDAVYVLKALNVISGRVDGSFDPRAYATREETAKIISGVMDHVAAGAAAVANVSETESSTTEGAIAPR